MLKMFYGTGSLHRQAKQLKDDEYGKKAVGGCGDDI
jgi:hypothetical protein